MSDELRDKIATLSGWKRRWNPAHAFTYGEWVHDDGRRVEPESHPVPALDSPLALHFALAGIRAAGWVWSLPDRGGYWQAYKSNTDCTRVRVPCTSAGENDSADAMHLLLKVLRRRLERSRG